MVEERDALDDAMNAAVTLGDWHKSPTLWAVIVAFRDRLRSLEQRAIDAAPAPAAAPTSPPMIALCEACGAAVLPHVRKFEPVNLELLAAVKEFQGAVGNRRMMSAGDWMLLDERLTAAISAAEAAPPVRSPAEERPVLERFKAWAEGQRVTYALNPDVAEVFRDVVERIDAELAIAKTIADCPEMKVELEPDEIAEPPSAAAGEVLGQYICEGVAEYNAAVGWSIGEDNEDDWFRCLNGCHVRLTVEVMKPVDDASKGATQ